MNKKSIIFLAGHKGLVGNAVKKKLIKSGYKNLILVDKKNLDLRDHQKTLKYFKFKKIDYIVMAAAKAGGILVNQKFQKDFFFDNIEIQNNLLKLALIKKVKRVIYLGTSCIYPKYSKNPIKENSLLTGKLEKTNQCYAIAKISGIILAESLYFDQKLDIVCLMPTNLYGENDNYDQFSGHVIPAIINKIYKAKLNKKKYVKLLGTGKPIREFLYVDDLAQAIFQIMKTDRHTILKKCFKSFPLINVGSGSSISISKLAKKIASIIEYKGKIIFDHNYPDGTPKKNLNSEIINSLGWFPQTKLEEGLKKSVDFYQKNLKKWK